jgi:hypothetical protein
MAGFLVVETKNAWAGETGEKSETRRRKVGLESVESFKGIGKV